MTLCEEKIQYATKKTAKTSASRRMKTCPGLVLYIYKCKHCHYYHLTTQERRSNR